MRNCKKNMAQFPISVIEIDDDEDDFQEKYVIQISDTEAEKNVPEVKKRTRRGIAFHKENVESDEDTPSVHVYTGLVNTYRETKKKFTPQEVLTEIVMEKQAEVATPLEIRSERMENVIDLSNSENGVAKVRCISPLSSPLKLRNRRHIRKKKIYKTIRAAEMLYKNTLLNMVSVHANVQADDDVDDDVYCLDTEEDRDIKVKIRCRLEITKIVMKKKQSFMTILSKLSQKFSIPENQIFLSFNDTTIYPRDTPKSIGLKISDIIDCGMITNNGETNSVFCNDQNMNSTNSHLITLKLQSKNEKNKMVFSINKHDPLSVVINQYARLIKMAADKIIFKFDGETLDPQDTPKDLELEDGFCIDVIHCT